jgi:hypothetical protein
MTAPILPTAYFHNPRFFIFSRRHTNAGCASPYLSTCTSYRDGSDEHEDLRSERRGRYRKHPKVYVGLFKHPMFAQRRTWLRTATATADEYRSNDWWRMPVRDDMRRGDDIAGE